MTLGRNLIGGIIVEIEEILGVRIVEGTNAPVIEVAVKTVGGEIGNITMQSQALRQFSSMAEPLSEALAPLEDASSIVEGIKNPQIFSSVT